MFLSSEREKCLVELVFLCLFRYVTIAMVSAMMHTVVSMIVMCIHKRFCDGVLLDSEGVGVLGGRDMLGFEVPGLSDVAGIVIVNSVNALPSPS